MIIIPLKICFDGWGTKAGNPSTIMCIADKREIRYRFIFMGRMTQHFELISLLYTTSNPPNVEKYASLYVKFDFGKRGRKIIHQKFTVRS
jgi:hypothetical protein